MKIKQIKIENFRCYYGKQTVNFNTDGKITLIYGLSGAGKTSFLQFINWTLYNSNNFGLNDKPLYNERKGLETQLYSSFNVSGEISFSHNGVDYELFRDNSFIKELNGIKRGNDSVCLQYEKNGSWVQYRGDIADKIHEIVPPALSSYFFFHGEKMDLVNNEDKALKSAIYKFFGLNVYEAVLENIGKNSTTQTLSNRYFKERKKILNLLGDSSVNSISATIDNCNSFIDMTTRKNKNTAEKLGVLEKKRKEIIGLVGEAQQSKQFQDDLKNNENSIKTYEADIIKIKKHMGNLMYQNTPYLSLSDLTKNTVKLLTLEAEKQLSNKIEIFEGLKKDLLKQILEKGKCICGKKLDFDSTEYIKNTIASMPPDSYVYQLKEFTKKSSKLLCKSSYAYQEIESDKQEFSEKKEHIINLNSSNKDLVEKLKNEKNTKDLSEQLSKLDDEIKRENVNYNNFSKNLASVKIKLERCENELKKATRLCNETDEINEKLEMIKLIKMNIEKEFNTKKNLTKITLEKSIKDVYEKLSTRLEDFDNVKFLNDDFSLRRTTKTGGQEVIDVYSYIIGMIKALHDIDPNTLENEFPIIIDAPFSHTDYIQATNVFETLPTVAPQVIILSLEVSKFKNSLNNDRVGNCYIIESDNTQTVTTICSSSIDQILQTEELAILEGNENNEIN